MTGTPASIQTSSPALRFTGTTKFTGYMAKIEAALATLAPGSRILDIPAGYGQFTDALRRIGHDVTPADISGRRPDFVYADMNRSLPFSDDAFDAAVCMEGIEHVLDPFLLLGELIRVVRPGGRVYLTTPNIMNFYSRLQFLLTGTFHQFAQVDLRDLPPDTGEDRGHISPISYLRMRYLADHFGADVVRVDGDRYKRKILFPLYALIHLFGLPWSRAIFNDPRHRMWRERNRKIHRDINSAPLLFSRSLILVLEKRTS